MRDIARAVKVCKWFLTYYACLRGVKSPATVGEDGAMRINLEQDMHPHLRSAVLLTLGYCYHARLSRSQRGEYRERLCEIFSQCAEKMPEIAWLDFMSPQSVESQLVEVQFEFVSQMKLGEGIALNEALRENLFMLLVSMMNQIPILLVGKPGCSKSLAMDILKTNLNGEVSEVEFFRAMPAVEVFAYQCSPLSTPEAILYAFNSARKSNIGDTKTIVCVLLDEVGLAEESPHLPLKVLHKELECLQGIACVGISNWALDAAKMNRCVMLYRPPPEVDDLRETAEGMAGGSANLKAYLRVLSEAFWDIYKSQKQPDFWGMREFYSTIKALSSELRQQVANGQDGALEPSTLMKVVLRNFGGRPADETEVCVDEFFDRVGMNSQRTDRLSKEMLISQNIHEPDARNLMLLTRNNAALRLLFEARLVSHQHAEVMFGGTFPGDHSDVFVAMNLQRVKTFMQRPICLVMVHCDALYESLYDLLNQHYMEYGGQRYVRIAHGSMSKQCPIHKLFRIIVVVEEHDAYFNLAPPLLNRFEKQVFHRRDLMTKADQALLARVAQFWEVLVGLTVRKPGLARGATTSTAARIAIPGFHQEMLASLVFSLRRRRLTDLSPDDMFVEARKSLVWALTPEAVCLMAARRTTQQAVGFDIVEEYFQHQRHADLCAFMGMLFTERGLWCDPLGAQVMVMSYSPVHGKVGDVVIRELSDAPQQCALLQEVFLNDLGSSQDLEKTVNGFYKKADPNARNLLLIRADLAATPLRMIEHCRFICEKARTEFQQRTGDVGEGATLAVLVVHLERGYSGFSFDFDSQWQVAFLDSIEPTTTDDKGGLPPLSEMLHTPLIDVIKSCDFSVLLKRCLREALATLVYPNRRRGQDLQVQIEKFLDHLKDPVFLNIIRDWTLRVLSETKLTTKSAEAAEVGETIAETANDVNEAPEAVTVGADTKWFADVAGADEELAVAGTLRAALHQRILVLITSLLAAFTAHIDRNNSFCLLSKQSYNKLWLHLAPPTLVSPLSLRLQLDGQVAVTQIDAGRRIEVITDAMTTDEPFPGRFPWSWFISKTVDSAHEVVKTLQPGEQMSALKAQYELTQLNKVGFNPQLDPEPLQDYLADFAAMHIPASQGVNRAVQMQIMTAVLQRAKLQQDCTEISSILEVHLYFWAFEAQVRFCVGLLDAVPHSLIEVERIVQSEPLHELNARILLAVHRQLISEIQTWGDEEVSRERAREIYRDWIRRKTQVAGLTQDFFAEQGGALDQGPVSDEPPLLVELRGDTEPRIETLGCFLRLVAYPLGLPPSEVQKLVQSLNEGKIRATTVLAELIKACVRASEENVSGLIEGSAFLETWILDVCLGRVSNSRYMDPFLIKLFCHLATGLPLMLSPQSVAGVAATGLGDDEELVEQDENHPIVWLSDTAEFSRSPCFNQAILRKLIRGMDGESSRKTLEHLGAFLVNFMERLKHNDSTYARNFAVVREEEAGVRLGNLSSPSSWPQITLQMLLPGDNPAKSLMWVGHMRWMLTRYASTLRSDDPEIKKQIPIMEGKLNTVLCVFEGEFAPLSRSLRLYVMKCLERIKGITYLRGALALAPLSEAA